MRGWRAGRSRRAQDAARFATPIAPPLWPPLADPVEGPTADAPVAPAPEEHADVPAPPAPAPVVAVQLEMQAEFLRLLEVVTSMCDHVIEYVENDRAERRVMVETLTDLGRVITDGAAAVVAATASIPALAAPASDVRAGEPAPHDEPFVHGRERVIGGSMPVGPEPIIDLVAPEAPWEPAPTTVARTSATDAAVEASGIRHVDPVVQHPPDLVADEPTDADAVFAAREGAERERDARVSPPPQYWSRS